ncbi:MAG: hypothetical protein ACJ762_19490 [Solirubrobacteraceae bacterium]
MLRISTALAFLALAASAKADTLVVAPTPVHAVYGQSIRVDYTGILDGAGTLYATVFTYVQPGRRACARTQLLESNRPASEQLHMFARGLAGPFLVRLRMEGFTPGLYRLCAYLQHTATTEDRPDALATALVRVQKSQR